MSDEYTGGGARGRGRRPPGRGGRRPGPRPRFDDLEDEDPAAEPDGYEDGGEEMDRPARRAARPGARRPAPAKRGSSWSLFGSKKPARRARATRDDRMDWGSAQDEESGYDEEGYEEEGGREGYDDYEEQRPSRRRHAPPREKRARRLTLMELCTPVFGYAAVLPRDMGGIQPGYQQFRQEVLNALQKIESDAGQHGIDRDDASKAVYALSLFMDEQVGESEWTGKMQWMGEPLSIVKLQDPEGGIKFFDILESLGERQKAVKEVYLVCLALGFRGKYAELEVTQQSARIAEVRQKVLRSIHPSPLESRRLLFPEAYAEAVPLEDEAPPPPKWWVAASLGTVAFCILIYILLFWAAGRAPVEAEGTIERVLAQEVSR